MLNLIRRILRKRSLNRELHLNRIMSGPQIIIDGKSFARVKVRIVDTIDFSTNKYIDQLETDAEMQKQEIERLMEQLSSCETKIEYMQTLNRNLLNQVRSRPDTLWVRIEELQREQAAHLEQIELLKEECKTIRKRNIDKERALIRLERKLAEKESMITSLEQTIKWLKSSDQKTLIDVNKLARLKRELRDAKDMLQEMKSKDKQV